MNNTELLVIDFFGGYGGFSQGAKQASVKVIACVNHCDIAIQTHYANHHEAFHFTEDIRKVKINELAEIIKHERAKYPNTKLIGWFSAECTNYSKAKGGLPRNADSRTLPESIYRFIRPLDFDFIYVENVTEFMAWGPLDEKGKPVSKDKGIDYLRWCDKIKSYGYDYEFKILNSADFGAYTSRNRYFGIFAKYGLPIVFPNTTHAKNPEKSTLFSYEPLKKWKAVKDVLDFSDTGKSIFNRNKPLVPATMERIYEGCIKHIAGLGKKEFISKYYSGNPKSKNISVEQPAGTITNVDHHALVQASFIHKYNSNNAKTGTNAGVSINEPSHWIDRNFTNGGSNKSIELPAGSMTANPKLNLISAERFLHDTNYKNKGTSLENPCPTITASRKYHYIINPSWFGNSHSSSEPCPVIIARQDKSPLYLITCEPGSIAIPVYEDDCEFTIRIKEFMVLYGIVDIKMRMLKISELALIMGFPYNYIFLGTQTEIKKGIGNAVEVNMAECLMTSLKNTLKNYKIQLSA